jgi:hypothetical protein
VIPFVRIECDLEGTPRWSFHAETAEDEEALRVWLTGPPLVELAAFVHALLDWLEGWVEEAP